jgi:hypothetical protein
MASDLDVTRVIAATTGTFAELNQTSNSKPPGFLLLSGMLSIYRHQVAAVNMMLERELGGIESSKFPSIWETTKFTDASRKLDTWYTRKVTLADTE